MKVGIIGTGYVGLPTGVGLAELGHDVICIDKDENKINALQNGQITLYEEGLEELLRKNFQSGKIKFTTSMQQGIADADVVLIAVGTPPHPVTKAADMQYIYAAAEELSHYLTGYTVVAVKSTVPVGTGDEVEAIIRKNNSEADFDVISVPEFLREGYAVKDFFNPDRIVIGTESERAKSTMAELYASFADKTTILYVKRRSSETIKYASNAFLAVKIHYINEMADFCEQSGADILEVAEGMGLDSRIGKKFLNPGPGYGGSCFPKDTNAMAQMAHKYGVHLSLIETTISKNDERKIKMGQRAIAALKEHPNGKIAVLGLAFKGGTDDCRESPAIDIVKEMIKHSQNICVYDPKAMENAKKILGNAVQYANSAEEACKNAEVLVVLTEWEDFRRLDLHSLKNVMSGAKIVDLRNMFSADQAEKEGFEYQCIGEKCHG